MIRVRPFVLLLLCSSFAFAAANAPDALIRVERRAADDLVRLLQAELPVVHETALSLFLEGNDADVRRARELGYAAEVLDRNPWAWDYLQVGVRPDTDVAALDELGAPLHAEENWRLVRVPRGERPDALLQARAFVTRLPHEPLAPPVHPPRPLAADRESTPDPLVAQMVAAVDPAVVDGYWTDLTENPPSGTRFTWSQGCRDAAAYCLDAMTDTGIAAEYQHYSAQHAPNVIGTHTGAVTPERVYIVIGHLDDMPWTGKAPGANDNASGSVTVLEAARTMSCFAFRSTVKFITCTGEELGLYGSTAYARDAKERGEDIRGVLNFDMNGWEGNGIPAQEDLDINYNEASADLADAFVQAAADYETGLAVNAFLCPSMSASDHYPFWTRGWDALCGITDNEGYCGQEGHYPYYHTRNDTIEHCGAPDFFHATIRTAVATLATLAEPFKVTFEAETVSCGESAALLVGDRDLDTDPDAAETVEVEVWSTTEPTPETITLTEEAASSMIFRGSVPTTSDPPVAGDGVVSVADGGTLSVRYVDAFDCDGSTGVEYTAERPVTCAFGLPDVENLTVTGDDPTRVAWDPVDGATSYDVAGGALSALRPDGGCSGAGCLADAVPDTSWQDGREDPSPGSGYYYVVRAAGTESVGSYGRRSDGAARSVAACP
jgi:hypothetical protein